MALSVLNNYYNYLKDKIDSRNFNTDNFDCLLYHLHSTKFEWILPLDANRSIDGLELRKRFKNDNKISDKKFNVLNDILEEKLDDKSSILEMMIALAIRCEEHIMSNSSFGDRTSIWFKIMIQNLGLSGMTETKYDAHFVNDILDTFIKRKFKRNGEGSLFVVERNKDDMRKKEIWYQMFAYLDENFES